MSPSLEAARCPDSKTRLAVFGAGGHAHVIADIVLAGNQHNLTGFIVTDLKDQKEYRGYRVLGSEADLASICQMESIALLALGIGDNWTRYQVHTRLEVLCSWLRYAVLVHPCATIGEGVTIGAGTVVMAGAVINSGTSIGDHSIINSGATIDHDNVIGDFVTLAPGVHVGGDVHIGDFAAICIGALLINGVRVGEHAVIGAGSTVIESIPGYCTAYGGPARPRKPRVPGEPYLKRSDWRQEGSNGRT